MDTRGRKTTTPPPLRGTSPDKGRQVGAEAREDERGKDLKVLPAREKRGKIYPRIKNDRR